MRAVVQLLSLAAFAAGSVEEITDNEMFEERVMKAEGCWAMLFTAKTRPEESTQALRKWELLAAANKQLTFGTADVDAVSAAVSEFNIRKRMIPRVLVFNSRARQAEVIKLAGEDVTADGLAASVLGFLAENPTNENGDCLRLTLAIGGKEEV